MKTIIVSVFCLILLSCSTEKKAQSKLNSNFSHPVANTYVWYEQMVLLDVVRIDDRSCALVYCTAFQKKGLLLIPFDDYKVLNKKLSDLQKKYFDPIGFQVATNQILGSSITEAEKGLKASTIMAVDIYVRAQNTKEFIIKYNLVLGTRGKKDKIYFKKIIGEI